MTPREVVENYWKVECTRDVDAILACYDASARLLVPGMGSLSGHDQIGRFYRQSVDRFPVLEVDIVGAFEDGDRGAFEWRAVFKDHEGATFRLKGVNVIRVSQGRLLEVNVYYDASELDAPAVERVS